jgi:hypothetical protein
VSFGEEWSCEVEWRWQLCCRCLADLLQWVTRDVLGPSSLAFLDGNSFDKVLGRSVKDAEKDTRCINSSSVGAACCHRCFAVDLMGRGAQACVPYAKKGAPPQDLPRSSLANKPKFRCPQPFQGSQQITAQNNHTGRRIVPSKHFERL